MSVSIVNFEQVNAASVAAILTFFVTHFWKKFRTFPLAIKSDIAFLLI